MSRTLNLIARLLDMGRNYQRLHQHRAALVVLRRLAAFRELPADVAEETQVRLAEIQLHRRKHGRARRHLGTALVYRPDSARYHHLMATALDVRTNGDFDRAADHYRKSLELDPAQARVHSDYGWLLLRLGNVVQGLEALRKAVELSPDDVFLVGRLAKGLWRADETDEALRVLQAARFRNPRDGRFRKLHNDLMYRWLRGQQTTARRKAAARADEGPVLLPFVGREMPVLTAEGDEKIIRLDEASSPAGPHLPQRPVRRPDWKHG